MVVSIPPQKYFVERIGGGEVEVSILVRPGESPATYQPKPSQLRSVAEADAYLAMGVPFEHGWAARLRSMFPTLRWVDLSEGIARHDLDEAHVHGSGDDAHPHTTDPHIWLSPHRVQRMTEVIVQTLSELRPARREAFEDARQRFDRDIAALDAEFRHRFTTVERRTFLVFHPSWGYFARDYGLEMLAIEQGGQVPSARDLAGVIEHARERGVRDVFVQPEFASQSARAVAEQLGGRVVTLSPLAEDWLANMRRAGAVIAESLTSGPGR